MKDKQITDIDEHIKYNLGTILVQTLLIGEFSEDYINELKKPIAVNETARHYINYDK